MTVTKCLDQNNPDHVAVAWSALVEPGDESARILIALIGEQEALDWVLADEPAPLPAKGDSGPKIRWKTWHQRLRSRAQTLDVEQELHRAMKLGIQVLSPQDPRWPQALHFLQEKEPLALWFQGNLDTLQCHRKKVSIVGSRASTAYGNRIAEQIAWELATQEVAVVSGGAYGIDTAAHRGALTSGKGAATVAVLCGGLGNLYPRGNTELFTKIKTQGLLLSEVPPHWRPARWRFLERNRIISALSDMTVVIEAGIRSGAIATANRASEIGRPLGVVPGPVTSAASAGCLTLLRETDATVVRGSNDILEELGQLIPADAAAAGPSTYVSRVCDAFPTTGVALPTELAQTSGLAIWEVERALLELQMQGKVGRQGSAWVRIQ